MPRTRLSTTLQVAWTAAAIGAFATTLVMLRRSTRRLPAVRPNQRHDLATALTAGELEVVIPARNEEATIIACLESVVAAATTNSPVSRIVVVNDRSTDATAERVRTWAERKGLQQVADDPPVTTWRLHRHCTLELLEGRPLPEGWYGKSHAITQGVERCGDADWLLFIDADTRLRLGSYAALVGVGEQYGLDLLSVLTDQELKTWWEKLFQPAVFGSIVFAFPPDRVNDPKEQEIAIANGQCMLVRSAAYRAVGGHASVRNTIAEDQQLALVFKSSGHRILLADGRRIASTRMYARWGDFWEGWTKNIFQATGGSFRFMAIGTGAIALTQVGPLPFALGSWLAHQRVASAFWAATAVALIGLRRAFDRYTSLSPLWSLTQPVGTAGLVALMLGSTWRAFRGTTVWRGRTYNVRADALPAGGPGIIRRIVGTLRP